MGISSAVGFVTKLVVIWKQNTERDVGVEPTLQAFVMAKEHLFLWVKSGMQNIMASPQDRQRQELSPEAPLLHRKGLGVGMVSLRKSTAKYPVILS